MFNWYTSFEEVLTPKNSVIQSTYNKYIIIIIISSSSSSSSSSSI